MKQFDVNYEREVSHNVLHSLKLGEIPGELKKGERFKKQQESEFFQELEPKPKVITTGEKTENQRKLKLH